ncbi:MAG: hypothetical protein KBS59_03780 [Clostridiales bacterium]|nr:hypothetical protein [Clostridiales bacterium]
METNYYNVCITVMSMVNANGHKENIPFKSKWSARYMAKKYFSCIDVEEVLVTDELTGEVIYSNEKGGEEYDSEG